MTGTTTTLAAENVLRLNLGWLDYVLVAIYFVFVLGIGFIARSQISTSLDFFLSGRRLPAWVTGLAFISANLGAVEIMGMSANGAQVGLSTMHYYWIGAIPAMLFLGVVMMPFYYGSKVRSVPEFMRRRFGPGAHLVNAISFATAQVLIAGVNLFLLATVINALLGWPRWLSLIVAALVVLSYITLGGLSAAIYNEVLQFFVIVAALVPLTIFGLIKVGGWNGLKDKVIDTMTDGKVTASVHEQLNTWPGQALSGFESPVWSVIGIVFGLGFVLSFGYWTTNFVEVQRAMASDSISAARRSPIIGSFPKMFIPFVIIVPGMIAAAAIGDMIRLKTTGEGDITYNDAMLLMIRDILPNGLLGVAVAGLLASFMAGMAANISAFNTVFSYDIWQDYVVKDRPDSYYIAVGRIATDRSDDPGHLHRVDRGGLLQPDGLPADAVRLLQRPVVRHVHPRHVLEADDLDRGLGRPGVRNPLCHLRFHPVQGRCDQPARPGRAVRRRVGGLRRRHPGQRGGHHGHDSEACQRIGGTGVLRDFEGGLLRSRERRKGLVLQACSARRRFTRPGYRSQHCFPLRRIPLIAEEL